MPRLVPHPTTPVPIPGYCPGPEWEPFGHHCYLFSPDEHTPWNNARLQCIKYGGPTADLVKVTSLVEDAYIEDRMLLKTGLPTHTDFWIGLAKARAGMCTHTYTSIGTIHCNNEENASVGTIIMRRTLYIEGRMLVQTGLPRPVLTSYSPGSPPLKCPLPQILNFLCP